MGALCLIPKFEIIIVKNGGKKGQGCLKEASSPVGCGSPSAPRVDSALRGGGVWIRERQGCLHVKEDFLQEKEKLRGQPLRR